MTKLVHRFLRDTRGATSIEYAVIAGMLSIVIVTAVTGLGSKLKGTFSGITTALN
jgi:pilus assembly protein Flp/PilA